MECAHSKGTDENTFHTGSEATSNATSPTVVAAKAEQADGAIPKEQLTQQLHKAEDKAPEESSEMLEAAVTEDLLNQLAVSELEFNLLQETVEETARKTTGEANQSPKEEWPPWSLPPPEENLRKKNAKKNNYSESNKAVNDSTVGEASESGFPSVEGNPNKNRNPSNIQSSSSAKRPPFSATLEVESETSQGKNAASPEIGVREEAVTTTPSRPITSDEAPHSSRYPLVTGLNRSYQSNAVAGSHPSVNHEPDSNNSVGGSGNPAEHDDTEYIKLLLAEAHVRCKEFRDRIREQREQQQRFFEKKRQGEIKIVRAENQQLKEMCVLKDQECKKLVEYIRQQDQRYDDASVKVGTLKKENKELFEELNTVIRQNEELQLQNRKLQEEREQQRLDFDKRTAVMSEECRNTEMEKVKVNVKLAKETSKAKRLKKQLKRERSKRMRIEMKLASEKSKEKRMEKRNKKVCKESREKTAQLENSQAQINFLQQDLEVTERLGFQYRRYFEENTVLLAESNEMCRKSWQMYLWKDEECKRMDELIGGMEARQIENQEEIEELHRSVTFAGKLYRSEKQQCKDKDAVLHIVNGLMKKLRQESKQQLQDVRERQKIELDRRVAEASQAFPNANSDEMKSMKLKLSMETKRVKRIKWMLARERSNRRKLELKLANKKRKGKRMEKRNKKSNIRKCPREEEEEGARGGGDDGDDYDDDFVFDDDDDDDNDSSQSGGMFGCHESCEDGKLSSTGPGKEGEGESKGGEGGGGDENNVDDDDEDNSDNDDNSSQSGGTNQGHESPDDGDFSSTGPRKEGGGEGGGNGVNDNHDNHDDCSQSAGTNGGHESQDEGDSSSTGQMTLGCMRRRK